MISALSRAVQELVDQRIIPSHEYLRRLVRSDGDDGVETGVSAPTVNSATTSSSDNDEPSDSIEGAVGGRTLAKTLDITSPNPQDYEGTGARPKSSGSVAPIPVPSFPAKEAIPLSVS